jgi:hypothetical protein
MTVHNIKQYALDFTLGVIALIDWVVVTEKSLNILTLLIVLATALVRFWSEINKPKKEDREKIAS